jgi:hypothetical protein
MATAYRILGSRPSSSFNINPPGNQALCAGVGKTAFYQLVIGVFLPLGRPPALFP